jgi:antitoxin (DNA-binding transcriptional repressor) of toxin-antitoxin stability system
MKKTRITVTEAARNFAECINRARYQNTEFVLLRNGKPVARITPENDKVCTGLALAEAVGQAGVSTDEARSWHKDLATARKRLIAPKNKWQ